jgi:hypothetical protein
MYMKNKESSHVVSPFYLKDVAGGSYQRFALSYRSLQSAVVENGDVLFTAGLVKQKLLADKRCFSDDRPVFPSMFATTLKLSSQNRFSAPMNWPRPDGS